jgi:hypothetical protein
MAEIEVARQLLDQLNDADLLRLQEELQARGLLPGATGTSVPPALEDLGTDGATGTSVPPALQEAGIIEKVRAAMLDGMRGGGKLKAAHRHRVTKERRGSVAQVFLPTDYMDEHVEKVRCITSALEMQLALTRKPIEVGSITWGNLLCQPNYFATCSFRVFAQAGKYEELWAERNRTFELLQRCPRHSEEYKDIKKRFEAQLRLIQGVMVARDAAKTQCENNSKEEKERLRKLFAGTDKIPISGEFRAMLTGQSDDDADDDDAIDLNLLNIFIPSGAAGTSGGAPGTAGKDPDSSERVVAPAIGAPGTAGGDAEGPSAGPTPPLTSPVPSPMPRPRLLKLMLTMEGGIPFNHHFTNGRPVLAYSNWSVQDFLAQVHWLAERKIAEDEMHLMWAGDQEMGPETTLGDYMKGDGEFWSLELRCDRWRPAPEGAAGTDDGDADADADDADADDDGDDEDDDDDDGAAGPADNECHILASTMIYGIKHFQEGCNGCMLPSSTRERPRTGDYGLVYITREIRRRPELVPGYYKWERAWLEVARYTRIPDDMMVIVNFTKSEDHDYQVFEIVPQSYENEEDEWNELRFYYAWNSDMETETDTEQSRRTATETAQSGASGTDSATGTNGSDPTITPGLFGQAGGGSEGAAGTWEDDGILNEPTSALAPVQVSDDPDLNRLLTEHNQLKWYLESMAADTKRAHEAMSHATDANERESRRRYVECAMKWMDKISAQMGRIFDNVLLKALPDDAEAVEPPAGAAGTQEEGSDDDDLEFLIGRHAVVEHRRKQEDRMAEARLAESVRLREMARRYLFRIERMKA